MTYIDYEAPEFLSLSELRIQSKAGLVDKLGGATKGFLGQISGELEGFVKIHEGLMPSKRQIIYEIIASEENQMDLWHLFCRIIRMTDVFFPIPSQELSLQLRVELGDFEKPYTSVALNPYGPEGFHATIGVPYTVLVEQKNDLPATIRASVNRVPLQYGMWQ